MVSVDATISGRHPKDHLPRLSCGMPLSTDRARPSPGDPTILRVLFLAHANHLHDAGEARTGRALVRLLVRAGIDVEVLCGSFLGFEDEADPAAWLSGRGYAFEAATGAVDVPPHFRLVDGGVSVTLLRCPTTRVHEPHQAERKAFLRLLELAVGRARPGVILTHAGCPAIREVLAFARARGIPTLLLPTDDPFRVPPGAAGADAALASTQFAADALREALALVTVLLPLPVEIDRVRAEAPEPTYVTFVDPTTDGGVYPFARIANELGRRRPDIPLLVVEGRGTEANIASCGLDLRTHGNLNVMAPTDEPRRYWGLTRIALFPSLGWEGQPETAVAALLNGLPVVASDRGGLPEVFGNAGVVLPLPLRLTPATCMLPTAEEVAPWVDAIIRLWDDMDAQEGMRREARERVRRWEPGALAPQYLRLIEGIRPRRKPVAAPPPGRTKCWVLVPHLHGIEWACEQRLRQLEQGGVRVVRREGSSAIDVARNMMASEALHEGAEAVMFIDADVGFDPADAFRLLARPEPVVAGVYAKKGQRAMASTFLRGLPEVVFGALAPGLYPMQYAATGFLRIRASVFRRMTDELDLPLCNTRWGRGIWPFFLPMIVPHDEKGLHYLPEDWAFSHRLKQIGIIPLADTSIRLLHYGRYGYTWEDAGTDPARYRSFTFRMPGGQPPASPDYREPGPPKA